MTRGAEMSSEELARRLAAIADDKKATDMVALDVRQLVGYTDYLVICTARNERQAKAIHDEVYHQLKRDGWLPARVEGERESEWVLMDYLDAVLHVFTPEPRERYRLEHALGRGGAARSGPVRRSRRRLNQRPKPLLASRSCRRSVFRAPCEATTQMRSMPRWRRATPGWPVSSGRRSGWPSGSWSGRSGCRMP